MSYDSDGPYVVHVPPLVVPEAARRRRWPWVAGGAVLLVLALVGGLLAALGRDDGPVGSDACGDLVAKPGGGTWACTFADDFDSGTLDPSKWMVPHGPATGEIGSAVCPVDDPRNVAFSDGLLHLSVTPADTSEGPVSCESVAQAQFAGGTIATFRRFSQQYGRFEARMRSDATREPGLHEAFWLWPDVRYPDPRGAEWPAAGEIDIAETYSQYPDLAVPFLHYGEDDNGGPQRGLNTAYCDARRGEWHTYTLEWTAEEILVKVDGRTCLRNTSGDPAFDKRFIILLTAGLGRGENGYHAGVELPATLSVDYVRVWE